MIDKNDKMLVRQIIMSHFVNPDQKGLSDSKESLKELQNSRVCSDEITVEIAFKDDIINYAKWDGVSCVISAASSDILAEQLSGKTFNQALEILTNYHKLIKNEDYEEDKLDELIVFINVAEQGNRVSCALLGANGYKNLILQAMEGENETIKTN
ncbi:iron-sulfur cluster assembly scaffold protein [Spiroplasma endosymbiont of Panorpa germanica]|uniref:iron-sulfur cluster assembly scaffold protein n=1 Tax=Spiroplasma endosymbiont of Panorpa germanica TaxID=3066314 RepID=UPI0030CE7FE3